MSIKMKLLLAGILALALVIAILWGTTSPKAQNMAGEKAAKVSQLIAPVAERPASNVEKGCDGKTYYVVRRGDSLSVISRKVYGTSKRWREILAANKELLPNERALKAGMKIVIPALDSGQGQEKSEEREG